MPDINIAATTALQAICPEGREKALEIGANVIMPNITPAINRANYQLYEINQGWTKVQKNQHAVWLKVYEEAVVK